MHDDPRRYDFVPNATDRLLRAQRRTLQLRYVIGGVAAASVALELLIFWLFGTTV